MLEIRRLTKVYQTKGVETKALDDVSISFPETGLVFLLGKSGSGKSTLLNLAGGLDEPTGGEVIVKGKSSKDFSGSDFDSYRNTFIGFIFQEYNVLNEFNVEDNIALALELQGKKKDPEKIDRILRDVELEAYKKRKPNTLSGGQKQRIAIARALVKDPQIIMADEPTGALDSTTGKQVFDTLKKLSETRLVIVVSHDREFAEIYGDRIVELKDGKIISDVTKATETPRTVGAISRLGENTLSVRRDKPLDKRALDEINAFLAEGDGEVIITKDGGDIATFKRANRIDDANGRETFRETDPAQVGVKAYDGTKTKFIRSRLPAGKAVKIGAAGLKLKPLRLIFTIFLSFIAFTMFGLFSTLMLYDKTSVTADAFLDSDYEYVMLTKKYVRHVTSFYADGNSGTYENYTQTKFTPAEIESVGGEGAFGVYGANFTSFRNLKANNNSSSGQVPYYAPSITAFAVLPEDHPLRQNIIGQYPAKADEICVSSYFFDCMKNMLYTQPNQDDPAKNDQVTVSSEQSLFGTKLYVDTSTAFTITGVFQSGAVPSKFDDLKTPGSGNDAKNNKLLLDFTAYLGESLHSLVLGAAGVEEHVSNSSESSGYVQNFDYTQYRFGAYAPLREGEQDRYMTDFGSAVSVWTPEAPKLHAVRFGSGTGALQDDEVIVSPDTFRSYYSSLLWAEETSLRDAMQTAQDAVNGHYGSQPNPDDYPPDYDQNSDYQAAYEAWQEEHDGLEDAAQEAMEAYETQEEKIQQLETACQILNGYYYDQELGEQTAPTAAQRTEAINFLRTLITEPVEIELFRENMRSGNSTPTSDGTYKIAGVYYYTAFENHDSGFFCSQKFYDNAGVENRQVSETKYTPEADATYTGIYSPIGTKAEFTALIGMLNTVDPETDVMYGMQNTLYDSIDFVNEIIENIFLVFLILGIVLAVFSALLLLNFITMSIANKKKEIGILRAVGARGTDVFKIFFAESGIIVGICTVLALVGSFVVAIFLNGYLKSEAGLQITLFSFGPLSILIMLGIAIVVAFIGTFLPVFVASRKKPVESIRAL